MIRRYGLFISGLFLAAALPLQAQYKLTLNLSNMGIHSGDRFQVRVVDRETGLETARHTLEAIPGDHFSVDLWALLENHSYNVDFYADFNGNGVYNAPPADHAYRLDISNVGGDVTLDFVHDTGFTDIQFPGSPDYAVYEGTWNGYWHNRTFDTQGDISAEIRVNHDSSRFELNLTTSGIFGIPDTAHFSLHAPFTGNEDSLHIGAPEDWTGGSTVKTGSIKGSIAYPAFGYTLNTAGNFGPGQLIARYTISDARGEFAEGIILLNKDANTSVNDPQKPGDGKQPEALTLFPNYPNPFNPDTRIRFSIARSTDVRLTVYDMLGREVGILLDDFREPGIHSVTFNGSGLASGPLFYRLEADGQIFTGKMILSE